MHFLILTIEYPPVGGGASPVIHEINKRFIRKGHKVSVVTMAIEGLDHHIIKDGIDIYHIRCFRMHKHISNVWEHVSYITSAKKFLKRFLQSNKVDFCYTHFILPTGILARWLWKTYQIPYVVTAHGSDIPGYNPDRFRFIHRFTPPLIRSIIHSSVAIVMPSKYLASLLLRIGRVEEDKLVHIPNGIDTDLYHPGDKKPVVLSTGRLFERKGFQFLIDAVSEETFPFEVHICGDGPMMHILKAKKAHSKTPVILHGWLDNKGEQYLKLLSDATYFVLVSAKENASLSLLEGLASGCVVITSDISGCPETVGPAGICIPPENVDVLKSVLKDLSSNPEKTNLLMKQGRERAITHFSWDMITDKYLSLIPENTWS
jgi:glycosyltransferase involved in cell wall biosynthesis